MLHLARMTCDRIGLCWFAVVLTNSWDLVACNPRATDRTGLRCARGRCFHRLTSTWPTPPPAGVHVLSDSGDFQPHPPLSALSCSSANLGTRGCRCVGSQGGSVPPLSQGSPCLLCPLPPPNLNGTAKETPHTLWGLNMVHETGCTQACAPGKGVGLLVCTGAL